ncbi:hypothetical protein HELRODRAFT_193192 [Helobdella robusta]|uniref:VWFA domain-containing protein n=1 Tax=Helobdella robusta TaxID=6412 RepID=T1FUQ4_HELRO|nr:hypothetical protein HELRODRAFT_193192 [Helobdella robusta]ESN97759.1 hypothetical protein HELRODRAFT_193192 [Helobdella robusta]
MKIFLVPCLIVSTILSVQGAVDETLVERARGFAVVQSVCAKINLACIFPEDKLILRRIAYVESNDGLDGDAYQPGYYGGIWKVDESNFLATKSLNPSLQSSIYAEFNIDWKTVSWKDLLKPFYSGLAARIYLSMVSPNIPRSAEDQALLWNQNYRKNGQTSVFVDKVNKLNTGCKQGVADIALIVDGSGSIGINNFNVVKSFLKNLTESLNIGPDPELHTRISVVQFSNSVQQEFDLNDHSTLAGYGTAVDKMGYLNSGTATNIALDFLATESFLQSSGARGAGIPKIGIVMTDGHSNNLRDTLEAAKRLHQKDITVIAIGIGENINNEELKAIATDPDCKNVFRLDGFFDLEALKESIEITTCEAPIYVSNEEPMNFTLPPFESKNIKITVSPSGLTIEIGGGDGVVFFSNETYPTSSFYDMKINMFFDIPAVAYFPGSTKLIDRYVYSRIESNTDKPCSYEIETVNKEINRCDPNPCPSHQKCVPKKHFSYGCIDEPRTSTTYNCEDKNPCTNENADLGKFFFPHDDRTKYVQCGQWETCHEMTCRPGMVWSSRANTCVMS